MAAVVAGVDVAGVVGEDGLEQPPVPSEQQIGPPYVVLNCWSE